MKVMKVMKTKINQYKVVEFVEEYKFKQGLSVHKKNALMKKNVEIIDNNNQIISTELVKEQLKLIEELEVLKAKMQEMCNLNMTK